MAMSKIPELAYEIDGDAIRLEQDAGCGEVHRIDLHPIHVRLIAGELNLMQGDADAWHRVATLERRLRVLLDRIDRLDDLISLAAQKGHEDLEVESALAYATWELATEFCHDLSTAPGEAPRQASAAPGFLAAVTKEGGTPDAG